MELSCTVCPNTFPIQPALKIKMLCSPPCVLRPVIILPRTCNEKRGVVLPTVIAVRPYVLTVQASAPHIATPVSQPLSVHFLETLTHYKIKHTAAQFFLSSINSFILPSTITLYHFFSISAVHKEEEVASFPLLISLYLSLYVPLTFRNIFSALFSPLFFSQSEILCSLLLLTQPSTLFCPLHPQEASPEPSLDRAPNLSKNTGLSFPNPFRSK